MRDSRLISFALLSLSIFFTQMESGPGKERSPSGQGGISRLRGFSLPAKVKQTFAVRLKARFELVEPQRLEPLVVMLCSVPIFHGCGLQEETASEPKLKNVVDSRICEGRISGLPCAETTEPRTIAKSY